MASEEFSASSIVFVWAGPPKTVEDLLSEAEGKRILKEKFPFSFQAYYRFLCNTRTRISELSFRPKSR